MQLFLLIYTRHVARLGKMGKKNDRSQGRMKIERKHLVGPERQH